MEDNLGAPAHFGRKDTPFEKFFGRGATPVRVLVFVVLFASAVIAIKAAPSDFPWVDATVTLGAVAVLLFVYFLPAIIAKGRRHRQSLAIFVLNLFAGWTVLGWIGALVWACTNQPARHQ